MPRTGGLIPASLFFGRGRNSHPDPEALERGELQESARVRCHKGILYKDKGVDQYGIATDAAAGPGGIGVHHHPTAPRLLVAAGGEVQYDSVGDGSVWTPIVTGLATDREVSFAGQSGVTYIANGRDKTLRYKGGASCSVLPDLPRPEDCPAMEIKPYPSDIFIDEFELAVTDWVINNGTSSVTVSTHSKQGVRSIRVITNGTVAGEGAHKDLGAGNEIDLSDSDYLGIWLFAHQAGTNLTFKMSEDDATYLNWPITVDEDDVDKWRYKQWDLRKIPPDDRDAIRYLLIETTEVVATTTWFDYLMHSGGLLGDYLYGVSFFDTATDNEGPIGLLSVISTVVGDEDRNIAPGRKICFPSRAVRMPDGADRVRLYRTLSGAGGRFYRIADVTPVANAWSYDDDKPDKELREDTVLNQWPGQCSRAAWLLPRGDRLWHVGGLVTGARNENTAGSALALNLASPVLVRGPFPPAPIYGAEIKLALGQGAGTITLKLQRSPKGGADWSDMASSTRNETFADHTWYLFPFVTSSNEDVFFSDEYDYRLLVSAAGGAVTAYMAWVAADNYLAYRLLVRADNAIFMSNLGEPDKIPPLGEYDHEPDAATGGFRTLASQDGQTINGWCDHGSEVLFSKQRRVYIAVGTNPDDFDYVCVLPSLGGRTNRSFLDCDGHAVLLAHDRQVYEWTQGTGPIMLSRSIEEVLAAKTEAELASACALYFDRRLFLYMPVAGVSASTLVYDFDEQTWTEGYPGYVYDVLRHGPLNTHTEPWALEKIGAAYGVRKLYTGENDDGGNITWSARSREDRFAEECRTRDPHAIKRLRAFWLVCSGTTDDTIVVAFHVNGTAAATRSYTLTIPGAGLQRIEGFPDDDIVGRSLSVKVSGSHDTETAIHRVELDLELVRE